MGNVLVVNQLTKGGITHYTACLVDSLGNATIITSFGKNEFNITGNNLKIKKILFPLTSNKILKIFFLFLNYVIIFINSLFYKNIHFQWPISEKFDKYLIKILNKLNKNTVFTVHNVFSHEDNLKENKEHYSNIYNKIIVHNDFSKKLLENTLNMNSNKIAVIPHGNYLFINNLCKELSKEEACNELSIPKNNFYALFFGYIRDYKGLFDLLESVKDLPDDFKIIIAGSTSDFSKYDQYIQENNLENKIYKFIKYIDLCDFGKYFYAADICVFPYKNIYQSGALQMAFAFKKACIVSNIEGFTDIAFDNENCIVYNRETQNDLKDKMCYCYNNRDFLKKIGENAYNFSKEKLDWKIIADKTKELYK